ncbi:hypothetical protein X797_008203 [Metarhizium robertsii]|uniref:Uncharacterized protein n=2 Tax=Metarhizium robertsii TaxID=568076 RepID=E9F9N9_METRA|nr:uncharacterized protein MAA_08988 [Metarhizium robertsii ARSEF 23]EFY95532.1 hypothetical protein MAA_08988 [Metarhizium robertsii ARSEF 23]EXU98728.1 hypothetical protein X797_008203 [Metarhizium robertsii]
MGAATFILFLCALAANAVCKTNFTQPPANGPNANYQDNPVYQQGQKIDVQWKSDLDTMDLFVFQQYPAAGKGVQFLKKLRGRSRCHKPAPFPLSTRPSSRTNRTPWRHIEGTRSTSLIWTVSLDGLSRNVPRGENAILYFAVLRARSPDRDGTSHYFNVSVPDAASTTAPATQTSDVPTMSTTTSAATDVPASSGESSPGLSRGGVAGVAVGSTVGGLLLLGGMGLLAWRKMRRGRPAEDAAVSDAKPPELAGPAIHEAPAEHRPRSTPVYEVP